MKKLRLSVEALAVETFEVDASLRGEGTVEARAAYPPSYWTECNPCQLSVDFCYPPSEGPNVAACAPPTPACELEDGGVLTGGC